jgi:hypothetical protein
MDYLHGRFALSSTLLTYPRAFPNWEKSGKLTPDEASSLVKGVSR